MFESDRKLYEYFLLDDNTFSLCNGLVRKLDLNLDEKKLLEWVEDFRKEYKRMPTKQELGLKTEVVSMEGIDDKVLAKEFTDFIRNKYIQTWIIKVAERLDWGGIKPEELYGQVVELVSKFSCLDLRIEKFRDKMENFLTKMTAPVEDEKIKIGINGLDNVLRGGVARGEFLCMIAPPGRGKSMFLINAAYGAVKNRKKVLFITLELSEEQIGGRFIRRIECKDRRTIINERDMVLSHLKFFIENSEDIFIFYHKPHELTVAGIRSLIEKINRQYGTIDVLIIDYFDRLKLEHKDDRIGLGRLVDGLRDLAYEKDLAVITATQANRASLSAIVVTEEHVADSFKKVESADIVLSFNIDKEKGKNMGRYMVLKNREYGNVGAQIPVLVDFDKSEIKDAT